MNYRTILIIAAVLLFLALSIGVGVKLVQRSEGYKADQQNFYSFEPHFLLPGCANYNVMRENAKSVKAINKPQIKPKIKKTPKKAVKK